MMGKIYSQCTEVIVWLGNIENERPPPDYPFSASDHVEPVSNTHAVGCECLNIAWESSKRLS